MKEVCAFFSLLIASAGSTLAAEIAACRMELVRTSDGEAAVFHDSVVITDKDTRIDADAARLYESRGLAVMSGSVLISSPDARIRADSARYSLSDRRAELFGEVHVEQDSLDIFAPHILHLAQDKLVIADQGLTLHGRTRPFRITGRRGRYDLARNIGLVDEDPALAWFRDEDTARVTSDAMYWYENESRAVAQGGVSIRSGASELLCDTVVFVSGPDSGLALGRPSMKDRSSSATGDTMVFFVRDGALARVNIQGRAAGTYRTEGGELIDISGRSISLELAGGNVERIAIRELWSGQLLRRGAKTNER
ncbi:MAG: LptA/OstA family protein [candidate division WOR-3 bacterium]